MKNKPLDRIKLLCDTRNVRDINELAAKIVKEATKKPEKKNPRKKKRKS